jgi:hypothetical protein
MTTDIYLVYRGFLNFADFLVVLILILLLNLSIIP